jgi:hypothetical protein
MAIRVCIDTQGLCLVVGTVNQQAGSELQDPLVLAVQGVPAGHRQVQMELLRNPSLGPGGTAQGVHLLERQARGADVIVEHQPVATFRVGLVRPGWLVAGPVDKAKELPVELREAACVSGIQDHLPQLRMQLFT